MSPSRDVARHRKKRPALLRCKGGWGRAFLLLYHKTAPTLLPKKPGNPFGPNVNKS